MNLTYSDLMIIEDALQVYADKLYYEDKPKELEHRYNVLITNALKLRERITEERVSKE